jgi:hypothetical protein
MQTEFKIRAQRARERMFRLTPGQQWHRGARVSRTVKARRCK